MNTRSRLLILSSTLFAAASCGRGGGGGGGGGQNNQLVASATLSTLAADVLTAPADGQTQVTLTLQARSTDNQRIANRAVLFAATGSAALETAATTTNAGGVAATKVSNTVAEVVTITATIDPDGNRVDLATPVQITFTPANAPVQTGPARYADVDGDAALSQGDQVTMAFSDPVAVVGATAADFVLPVAGDTLGTGATVAAGANDREVVITLGSNPVMRSRGLFAAGLVEDGSPSAIQLAAGATSIRSTDTATPAVSPAPSDIVPAYVANNGGLQAGEHVAAADTSNDRIPDVLTVTGSQLNEFVGNGDGTFTAGGTAQLGAAGQAVAAADLNNFTRAEVIVGLPTGAQIFNNTTSGSGASSFNPGAFLGSGDTRAIAIGDIDNDGFPDVITGGPAGVSSWLHQRNLGNTYALGANLAINDVQCLHLADLDGDGSLDLMLGTSANITLFRGDGQGQLLAAGTVATVGAVDLATADFLGNGLLGVASSNGSEVLIHDNLGNLTFAIGATVATPATQLRAIDVDGDSFADLVVASSGAVRQLMNDRNGGFEDAGYDAAAGGKLAAMDMDADGDVDVASISSTDATALRNSLAGSRGLTRFDRTTDLGADVGRAQVFGDVNGDGVVDRLLGTSAGAQVWLGDGLGSFTFTPGATTFLGNDDVRAVALADFDADGDLDAILGAFGSSNSVWQNDGAGQFTQAQTLGGNTQTQAVAVLDFEDDGDLDVVFGNVGANEVYSNASTPGNLSLQFFADAFSAPNNTILLRDTVELLARDVDSDGDDDLVVVNRGTILSPQDSYLFKQSNVGGDAKLSVIVTFNAQLMSPAATFGDINGDGFVDLVMTRVSPLGNATIQFYKGQRTTISNLPSNIAATANLEAVTISVADFNGDNQADILFGERTGGAQLLLADSLGAFTATTLTTAPLGQLTPLDIDQDGDLDIVTAENGTDRIIENR